MFADLVGSSWGRPSVPADVGPTVMVLQALEGLSDRDAVTADVDLVEGRGWPVADR
jgi:hypothetical protein